MQNDDLDSLLDLAAQARPAPSPALIDRGLADAYALQPQPANPVLTHPALAKAKPGVLSRLAAMFGGGPVLAGVCTAALAGVTLGYLSPATYDYLTGGLIDNASEAVDLFPTTDFLSSEG